MSDTHSPQSAGNRRNFLRKATLVAPAAAILGGTAHAARTYGGLPESYRGLNARAFREIQSDENVHVETLLALLGPNASPKPTFQGLEAANARQFAVMAQTFENTGVGAYLGASGYLSQPNLLAAAASIGFVESYHSGYLNTLLNGSVVPNSQSFAPILTSEQVVAALTPYVASLNGGPMPGYATTLSAANDVAIANFALVAEYLEREFYNINVPKFFG